MPVDRSGPDRNSGRAPPGDHLMPAGTLQPARSISGSGPGKPDNGFTAVSPCKKQDESSGGNVKGRFLLKMGLPRGTAFRDPLPTGSGGGEGGRSRASAAECKEIRSRATHKRARSAPGPPIRRDPEIRRHGRRSIFVGMNILLSNGFAWGYPWDVCQWHAEPHNPGPFRYTQPGSTSR